MTILFVAIAFVVGLAAGGMFTAACLLAAATRATKAHQEQLAAAYSDGLLGRAR